jgi:hypothetical protein
MTNAIQMVGTVTPSRRLRVAYKSIIAWSWGRGAAGCKVPASEWIPVVR